MAASADDDARFDNAAGEDVEVGAAVPVLSEAGPIEARRPPGQVVARQAAAVAATSFAAGVVTVALARAHKHRRADRRVALVPRGRAPSGPARLTVARLTS